MGFFHKHFFIKLIFIYVLYKFFMIYLTQINSIRNCFLFWVLLDSNQLFIQVIKNLNFPHLEVPFYPSIYAVLRN